jgi:dTDP-4-amino-4,6-dideoxygalactose transaminase
MASSDQPDRIPFADPGSDLAPFREDILAAVGRVLDARQYILGPLVETFEREFAARLGVGGVVGVASGTDALALTLQALNVGAGDEVITVSHTAGATVAAIRITGATPVLIDVEPVTYCMDPAKLALAYGPRTKAIVPVHLYGHPADMAPIIEFGRRHGIAVVEDCAQAQEATIDDWSAPSELQAVSVFFRQKSSARSVMPGPPPPRLRLSRNGSARCVLTAGRNHNSR